jgi:hypothetical protein
MARGAIERRSDGAWILRGNPPSEERIETAAAVPVRAAARRGAVA